MPFILYSIWHYVGFLVWHHTKIVVGRSHHSISFLNENPQVKRRSRHLVSIFNQNPCLMLRSRHPDFFFQTEIQFPRYRRGGRSGHMLFWGYKRQEHVSKTRAKCEKHVSLPSPRLHSFGTLLPFSYGMPRHQLGMCRMFMALYILIYRVWKGEGNITKMGKQAEI